MSILKYIDRLKRMDDLIRRKATGTPEEFAERLCISPSQLYTDLKEMRALGAPIDYCPKRRSYFYEQEGNLVLNFATEGQTLKGGQNIFENLIHSSMAGVSRFTFNPKTR